MIDTDVLAGFTKLAPEKAAAVLPGFKANIYKLIECNERKAELLKQLIFHVALKAKGFESKDVQSYIYEHVIRRRKLRSSSPDMPYDAQPEYELVDAVDWKTGYVKSETLARKTGRIAGVLLKDEHAPNRIIKFDEPLDHWK